MADALAATAKATDSLTARSIRFAITVTAPIALNLVLGPKPWLVYALITSIASYSVDNGGRAALRLAWMGAVGVGIVAGAGIGSVGAASHRLTLAGLYFGGGV